MKKAIAMMALALATSGCGGIHDYRKPYDRIIVSYTQGDVDTEQWYVSPDEGAHERFEIPQGGQLKDRMGFRRAFEPSEADYQRIRDLMRDAEPFFEREVPCESRVPGQLIVTIQWISKDRDGKRVARFDLGCRSAAADTIKGKIAEANALVRSWSEGKPVEERPAALGPR